MLLRPHARALVIGLALVASACAPALSHVIVRPRCWQDGNCRITVEGVAWEGRGPITPAIMAETLDRYHLAAQATATEAP